MCFNQLAVDSSVTFYHTREIKPLHKVTTRCPNCQNSQTNYLKWVNHFPACKLPCDLEIPLNCNWLLSDDGSEGCLTSREKLRWPPTNIFWVLRYSLHSGLSSNLRECIKPEALSETQRPEQLLLSIRQTDLIETSVLHVTTPTATRSIRLGCLLICGTRWYSLCDEMLKAPQGGKET